jgi:glycosyltransferase involved in cell wall biosynthesis
MSNHSSSESMANMTTVSDNSHRLRVLFFGTHPNQFNGYSKVVYNLMKRLENWRGNDTGDMELFVFGFQNFYNNLSHDRFLKHTKIYDAHYFEEPKNQGFGFDQVGSVYASVRPHICIVYNDMLVVANVLQGIINAAKETSWKSRVLVYADQVYDCQKLRYIDVLNSHADGLITFTNFWRQCILDQGIRENMPVYVLPHGLDRKKNYPVPRGLARKYLGLGPDDFLIFNANRNQPRKRWDICVMAFAQVVKKYLGKPIKLVVGTTASDGGSWNLVELFQFEFRKLGVPVDKGLQHLVFIEKPQLLTDEDINALYNACDIGINTCDGEGFGLCNFEHAAVGKAQIVPNVGGFKDIFRPEFCILVEPKLRFYVDSTRDHVGGMAEMCDYNDFAAAIEMYYSDETLRQQHGKLARQHILKTFDWDDVARCFEKIIDLNQVTVSVSDSCCNAHTSDAAVAETAETAETETAETAETAKTAETPPPPSNASGECSQQQQQRQSKLHRDKRRRSRHTKSELSELEILSARLKELIEAKNKTRTRRNK